jgi:hypothetical protein
VMGRGVALQAIQRMPDLQFALGAEIRHAGNHVYAFWKYRVVSFPVKAHWREQADLELISRSARELSGLSITRADGGLVRPIYLPRAGCGNGRLRWEDVRPLLAAILDDRFIIVERA